MPRCIDSYSFLRSLQRCGHSSLLLCLTGGNEGETDVCLDGGDGATGCSAEEAVDQCGEVGQCGLSVAVDIGNVGLCRAVGQHTGESGCVLLIHLVVAIDVVETITLNQEVSAAFGGASAVSASVAYGLM